MDSMLALRAQVKNKFVQIVLTKSGSIVRVYNRPLGAHEVAGNYAAEMGQPANRK